MQESKDVLTLVFPPPVSRLHIRMSQSLAPFSCSYTREVPDLLAHLRCSLALTTYQAGKVLLLSPDGERLVQLTRNFNRPMGLAVDGGRMAVAAKYEVVVLENAPSLAPTATRPRLTSRAMSRARSATTIQRWPWSRLAPTPRPRPCLPDGT